MQYLSAITGQGGGLLSAWAAVEGGKEAAEMGKLQQKQFNAEADAVLLAGGEAALEKRKEGRRLTASQIAAISASGGGLVGSNLVVMAESARNVEMDALTIERNAGVAAQSLRFRGQIARYEGQLAKRNARIRATAGMLSTAGGGYADFKRS